jgi:thymidylate synthase
MGIKTLTTELKWFLRGDTNIKFLVDNGCHIWDGDAYKNYEKNNSKIEYIGSKCSLCGNISNHDTDYPNEYDTNCIHCGKEDKWEHQYKDLPSLTQEEFINKIKTDDEFAKKWGELGPIYGKQWRRWVGESKTSDGSLSASTTFGYIDQIQNLINDLKTNPDSRRLMVNAWNVGELDQMVLPPCHYGFQVYTRELSDEERLSWMKQNRPKTVLPMRDPSVEFSMDEFFRPYGVPKRAISLMWNQRSVDTFLGLPFNIASYGMLLLMIAKEVNMVPDQLIGSLGDVHLYLNHIEQAEEQIEREPFELPKMDVIESDILNGQFEYNLVGYQSHGQIKAPLSN